MQNKEIKQRFDFNQSIDLTLRGVARAYEIIDAQNARKALLQSQQTDAHTNRTREKVSL